MTERSKIVTDNKTRPIFSCDSCEASIPLDRIASGEVVKCPRCGFPNVPMPRCDAEQLKILRHCSKVDDMADWNQGVFDKTVAEVWLQKAPLPNCRLRSANLCGAHLEGAILNHAHLEDANLAGARLEGAKLSGTRLDGANLGQANLERADLVSAHLQAARLWTANLDSAICNGAHFQRSDLGGACLQGAELGGAFLHDTHLNHARLNGAYLEGAYLNGATLIEAHLEGATLKNAFLNGADFSQAVVDGETLIDTSHVDRRTYFGGVGLGACRLRPGIKETLEYNIRRKRWESWYTAGRRRSWAFRQCFRLFWSLSDYGRSARRVALWFLGFSLAFAAVYFICGLVSWPGIVEGLFTYESVGEVHRIGNYWLVAWRALYFSVVTMTTLGFGDIAAQPLSWAGHGLLMLQVILGYVLLGALICRFAVLFQADGPSVPLQPSHQRRLLRVVHIWRRAVRRMQRALFRNKTKPNNPAT